MRGDPDTGADGESVGSSDHGHSCGSPLGALESGSPAAEAGPILLEGAAMSRRRRLRNQKTAEALSNAELDQP